MQPLEYRSVRYWSKEINGTLTGGQKTYFFKSRPTMAPWSMAAAPVESCQSLSKRSPWGRLGSVLYTCKRLHRTRRGFKHNQPNSLDSARRFSKMTTDGEHKIYVNSHYATYIKARSSEPVRDAK